jgi:hypothetical protein
MNTTGLDIADIQWMARQPLFHYTATYFMLPMHADNSGILSRPLHSTFDVTAEEVDPSAMIQ